MRLFHESPELTLRELTLPFLDARKRVAHYPRDRRTASGSSRCRRPPGTGSEVSPAAVLTVEGRKVTLVDYSLVPDMAIVEPRLTLTMPPQLTADTGVDALTHALEACVSIFASPYTDAFCLQAINLILDALPRAYADGADLEARTDMANAATIAGLAFSNAFVGVNHALAHAVGARFGVAARPRQRALPAARAALQRRAADASSCPRRATAPTSRREKYAQIAWVLGLGGHGEDGARASGCSRASTSCSRRSACRARSPRLGIDADAYRAAIPELVRDAFRDPSVRTNPRMPMIAELAELFAAVCPEG